MTTPLESNDHKVATSSPTDSSHALDGIWNKSVPANSTDAARSTDTMSATVAPTTSDSQSGTDSRLPNESSTPIFTDSDGKPISDAKVSGMTYKGFGDSSGRVELAAMTLPRFPNVENADVTTVSDRSKAKTDTKHPTASALSTVAHDAVGSNRFGNKVPASARENAGYDVPQNLKCAATSSEWLVNIGMMTNRDYKIRVADMMTLLPEKGFTKVPLKGDFDPSKFPDGPIGFITGRRNFDDNSNHIGFVEKRNGQVHVIHNDYHTGRVVDQNITEKFYKADGKPAYRDLNLFIFPKKNS